MWTFRPRVIGRTSRVLLAAVWLAMVAAGFLALEAYEKTPGAAGRSRPDWPEGSAVGFVSGAPNVVMALHPRCACSRASLAVFREVARRSRPNGSLRLLVYRPEGAARSWLGFASTSDPIEGVGMVDDPGGREASRFGLETSGAVAAFDAAGRLKFTGGLTAGRGREAPSEGAEALVAILEGRGPARSAEVVFGCGLGIAGGGP